MEINVDGYKRSYGLEYYVDDLFVLPTVGTHMFVHVQMCTSWDSKLLDGRLGGALFYWATPNINLFIYRTTNDHFDCVAHGSILFIAP